MEKKSTQLDYMVAFLLYHGSQKTAWVAQELGIKRKAAYRMLCKLEKQGRVKKTKVYPVSGRERSVFGAVWIEWSAA